MTQVENRIENRLREPPSVFPLVAPQFPQYPRNTAPRTWPPPPLPPSSSLPPASINPTPIMPATELAELEVSISPTVPCPEDLERLQTQHQAPSPPPSVPPAGTINPDPITPAEIEPNDSAAPSPRDLERLQKPQPQAPPPLARAVPLPRTIPPSLIVPAQKVDKPPLPRSPDPKPASKQEEFEQLFLHLMGREITLPELKGLLDVVVNPHNPGRANQLELFDRLLARLRGLRRENRQFTNFFVLLDTVRQMFWIQ